MPLFRALAALAALALLSASAAALADTDCSDPIAQWKPRELLRQQIEQRGWTVQRIKVDDGCYEVRGLDRKGNKIKAKYAPASLRIRSLEVEFGPDGDASDYAAALPSHLNRPGRTAPASQGNLP
ncbi:PepSY domain-containing protein [Massilia glaciei]|uniref:PepSY domain-containing protein n=1 Tax=Massilia glaciei TaxID=1524097 RepID=A0A2U2HGN6_9BURK|nr:PepSY domain-containing protein [Massilia glaciei]PWF44042.1 PepSY domain-containing protein [Massilia glaciei]